MKDKTTAGIIALLLGGLGIHKFYLGNNVAGIFYFLFCWTFIPAIIALIEGIILLTMDEKTFNEKYNEGKSARRQSNNNVADELEKLHALKEKGILSEEEFQAKKGDLL